MQFIIYFKEWIELINSLDEKNKEIERIRKEKEAELEEQLKKDRKRLDEVRRELHELLEMEQSKVTQKKIQLNLI